MANPYPGPGYRTPAARARATPGSQRALSAPGNAALLQQMLDMHALAPTLRQTQRNEGERAVRKAMSELRKKPAVRVPPLPWLRALRSAADAVNKLGELGDNESAHVFPGMRFEKSCYGDIDPVLSAPDRGRAATGGPFPCVHRVPGPGIQPWDTAPYSPGEIGTGTTVLAGPFGFAGLYCSLWVYRWVGPLPGADATNQPGYKLLPEVEGKRVPPEWAKPRPKPGTKPLQKAVPVPSIPARPMDDPFSAPGERSERGPAARPRSQANPEGFSGSAPGAVPGMELRVRPRTLPQLRPAPPHIDKPPGPRVREKKTLVARAVMKAVSGLTEAGDLLDNLYFSLPAKMLSRERFKRHGKDPNPTAKLQILYKHYSKIDWKEAMFDIAWDQLVEDFTLGKLSQLSKNPFNKDRPGGGRELATTRQGDEAAQLPSGVQLGLQHLEQALRAELGLRSRPVEVNLLRKGS